jgi:hypothetical protein
VLYAAVVCGLIALPKLVALFRSPPDKMPETARAVFGRPELPRTEPPGYILRLPPPDSVDKPPELPE